MTYTIVENFRAGLDTRRLLATSEAGTLINLVNAHINQGGEIEKRKAFDPVDVLPAGTHGAYGLGDDIYIFGSDAAPVGLPPGYVYQRLQAPDSEDMVRVCDVDLFAGKLYVIAEYADGDIHHFFDGTIVTDWEDGRAYAAFTVDSGVPYSAATAEVVTLRCTSVGSLRPGDITLAGVPVALTASDVANLSTAAEKIRETLEAYVPARYTEITRTSSVVRVVFPVGAANPAHVFGADDDVLTWPASGTNLEVEVSIAQTGADEVLASSLDAITVAGVDVLREPVVWQGDAESTAEAIAAQVSRVTSSPNYTATTVGARVILKAAERGAGENGKAVVLTTSNGLVTSALTTPTAGGSATAGTYQPGEFAMSARSKVYALAGDLLHFCALNAPTIFDTADGSGVGQGVIDMTTQASQADRLQAVVPYFNYHAVFSRRVTQLWQFDVDPDLNTIVQVLPNTGTLAPKSVTPFGANDVFYLASNGVRSLRARDTSTSAAVTDVGSAVDALLLALILEHPTTAERAIGIIEPTENRYLLIVGDTVFVFSFFPGGKVSAWSTYLPGFEIEYATIAGDRLVVRSGDTVYVYGGRSGLVYDDCSVTARLPYMDTGKPGHPKPIAGLDVAAKGRWGVYLGTNPNAPDVLEYMGFVVDTTYDSADTPLGGEAHHFSLEFRHEAEGPAVLGQVTVYHDFGDAE